VPEQPEVLVLDTAVTDVRDNAVWHTDVTFLPTPALGAVLSAKQLPAFGGDTLWASGIAAFEGLSEPMQRLLDGPDGNPRLHQVVPAGALTAPPRKTWRAGKKTRKNNPPLSHPVIRTHPVSGRKALFVNEGFTTRINELSEAESEAHPEAVVRPRHAPGIHHSLALAGKRRGVLGQPRDSALRRGRLPPQPPRDAPRDDSG
jgi:taurine dioxygenase